MEILEVRATRKSGIYHHGEKIVFKVKGKGFSAGTEIPYVVRQDCAKVIKTGTVRPGAAVEVSAGKPGFIDICLTHGDRKIEAAAAVDPRLIKPSASRPADFKTFWKKKLAALAAVPLNLRLKKIPAPSRAAYEEWNSKWPVFGTSPWQFDKIAVFEAEADTAEGEPVRGYLAYPAGAKPKSLPAVLFTHGAGIGDSDLLKTCAAARHGFLAMDINSHGLQQGRPAEYYQKFAGEITAEYDSIFKKGRLDKNTSYLATMYLRHRRALDVLCSRPEWNGKTLVVRGASQGGCLALSCAGLDERVSAICPGVPALCDNTYEYPLNRWFCNDNDDKETIAKIKQTVKYFAVENFAPDIKAEAYFTVAFLDRSCHPTTIYAAYNRYGGPKKIFNGPTANHGGIPNAIHYDDCTGFMFEHAKKHR